MKQIHAIFMMMTVSFAGFADVIDDGSKQYYGTITSIDKENVTLKLGCTGSIRRFKWTDINSIEFSKQCAHPGFDLSTSPITAEDGCEKRMIFLFRLVKKNETAFADEFTLKDGKLHIVYAKGKGTKEVPSSDLYEQIEWVIFRNLCESEIPDDFEQL